MRVTKQIKRLHKLVIAKLQSIKRELIAEKQVIDIYDDILGDKTQQAGDSDSQQQSTVNDSVQPEAEQQETKPTQQKASSRKAKSSGFKL